MYTNKRYVNEWIWECGVNVGMEFSSWVCVKIPGLRMSNYRIIDIHTKIHDAIETAFVMCKGMNECLNEWVNSGWGFPNRAESNSGSASTSRRLTIQCRQFIPLPASYFYPPFLTSCMCDSYENVPFPLFGGVGEWGLVSFLFFSFWLRFLTERWQLFLRPYQGNHTHFNMITRLYLSSQLHGLLSFWCHFFWPFPLREKSEVKPSESNSIESIRIESIQTQTNNPI